MQNVGRNLGKEWYKNTSKYRNAQSSLRFCRMLYYPLELPETMDTSWAQNILHSPSDEENRLIYPS